MMKIINTLLSIIMLVSCGNFGNFNEETGGAATAENSVETVSERLSNEDVTFINNIEYNDFIIYEGTIYVNINEIEYKDNILNMIKTEYGGELLKSGDLGSVVNKNDAVDLVKLSSVLLTGTRIFKYYVSEDMVLAELNEELILYVADKEVLSASIYSPFISENFTDYVFFDGLVYVNIANEPSWKEQNYEYIRGDFFGEILHNSNERNKYKLEDSTSNVLPVGTKFYKFEEEPQIILADTEIGLIPYLVLVEG
jgi:hypothetical protein